MRRWYLNITGRHNIRVQLSPFPYYASPFSYFSTNSGSFWLFIPSPFCFCRNQLSINSARPILSATPLRSYWPLHQPSITDIDAEIPSLSKQETSWLQGYRDDSLDQSIHQTHIPRSNSIFVLSLTCNSLKSWQCLHKITFLCPSISPLSFARVTLQP